MSAVGLLRGWLAPTLARQGAWRSPAGPVTAQVDGRELEAGSLAVERGYLALDELLLGLDRWAQAGRHRGSLLDLLVREETLMDWQRDELEQLLDQGRAPPVPWEELGAGD